MFPDGFSNENVRQWVGYFLMKCTYMGGFLITNGKKEHQKFVLAIKMSKFSKKSACGALKWVKKLVLGWLDEKKTVHGWVGFQKLRLIICIRLNTKYPPGG